MPALVASIFARTRWLIRPRSTAHRAAASIRAAGLRQLVTDYIVQFYLDFETRLWHNPHQPRSSRGASRGDPECGARRGVPGGVGYRAAGGPRDPLLRVTMTRAANKVAARSRRECRTTARTGPGRKSPRWSAARRASPSLGTRGASQAPGVPVMAREPGCLAGIRCACRRSPPPRPGWKRKTSGATRRGKKRRGKGMR